MNELHLFSGIGGGILGGLLLGHRCIGAVEIDPYCRSVLQARQDDGCLPPFPIFDDVRSFDGTAWRGKVDVLCGGFPCQPWSQAGKRKGAADPRHLWPEMARIVSECRPRFVFAENVSMAAFEEPWRDLRGMGYRVPPALCLGASHVGAPHRRLRWWMLAADTDSKQHEGCAHAIGREIAAELFDVPDAASIGRSTWRTEPAREQGGPCATSGSRAVADANRPRLAQRQGEPGNDGEELAPVVGSGLGDADSQRELQPQGRVGTQRRRAGDAGWWATEPRVGRVAHGIPARVAQLKALGNAQVPQVAAEAFAWLMQTHYRGEGTA